METLPLTAGEAPTRHEKIVLRGAPRELLRESDGVKSALGRNNHGRLCSHGDACRYLVTGRCRFLHLEQQPQVPAGSPLCDTCGETAFHYLKCAALGAPHVTCRSCLGRMIDALAEQAIDGDTGKELRCPGMNCGTILSTAAVFRVVSATASTTLLKMLRDRERVAQLAVVQGALAKFRAEIGQRLPAAHLPTLQIETAIERRLRAEHLLKGLRGTGLQCPECSYGPVVHYQCTDLRQHDGEAVGHRGLKIDNSCPQCGFFSADVAGWRRWDGALRELDESYVVQRTRRQCERGATNLRDAYGMDSSAVVALVRDVAAAVSEDDVTEAVVTSGLRRHLHECRGDVTSCSSCLEWVSSTIGELFER